MKEIERERVNNVNNENELNQLFAFRFKWY